MIYSGSYEELFNNDKSDKILGLLDQVRLQLVTREHED